MKNHKTNYELSKSQVATPIPVVDLYWKLLRQHRPRLGRVLDLGAGDARFSRGGHFQEYIGIEIDPVQARKANVPPSCALQVGCAFAHTEKDFDACIGNPPYVRHHDIESPWKERTLIRLGRALGIQLDGHGNLFLYFLALGLLKTRNDGLVAMLLPFEWVSRPSAKSIRDLIDQNKWEVSVYRFQARIFDGVLTTASIAIIDKQKRSGKWQYFNVAKDFAIRRRSGISGTRQSLLKHEDRSTVFAQRGLSPGSQKIFTLTEGERVHHGLKLTDVLPCVTSLREVPGEVESLTRHTFTKHFIQAGRRCWLIKSSQRRISQSLRAYLAAVPAQARSTYTCLNQVPWHNYESYLVPSLLVNSAFVEYGPKILINSIGAVNVGSVYGVYLPNSTDAEALRAYLATHNVEKRIVAHAKTLKKIEVRQLNSLLGAWWQEQR